MKCQFERKTTNQRFEKGKERERERGEEKMKEEEGSGKRKRDQEGPGEEGKWMSRDAGGRSQRGNRARKLGVCHFFGFV